ncbi:MAG: hypothetical protein HOP12_13780 [Candidatus Eisenbacteria bacterium]|uniref:PpiC domain-containing protein n=1 Tax=Eiseniibacteriota bacterium TaxID=2212470 RepID=A0A849SIL7_UNCEI|nr:hypothetical protein [Candidatus Eisenbacteria bacterium]
MIRRRDARNRIALVVLALALAVPVVHAATARPRARVAAARDTVLVRVGSETITTATVNQRINELPEQVRSTFTTPDGRQRLIERLVEEKVWLMAAQKAGVSERPDLKTQLEQQRRDLLIRTYVTELMANNAAPSDSEAMQYYREHLADYRTPATVSLSHLQTRTEAEARRLLPFARKQDWKALVTKNSTDTTTRRTGGSLGVVTREGLFGSLGVQPALAESSFTLAEGAIGGPWRTERGWHLIRLDSRRADGERPFEQVRQQIMRQLSAKRSQDFYQNELQKAKQNLRVTADSAAIKSFVSQRKSAREQFNEAQLAGAAADRIQAYRALLADHPDSDVSAQAQFMIGFIQSEELKDFPAADASFRELLKRWPKSELVASAQWMVDHMRSEDAPAFMNLEGDSSQAAAGARKEGAKRP